MSSVALDHRTQLARGPQPAPQLPVRKCGQHLRLAAAVLAHLLNLAAIAVIVTMGVLAWVMLP